ncbi:response regulator transcription factor [Paenibacillus timonensis]|jgi:DNA-binding response OmpR family regulator|uniref:Response regulator transcription factor n=2 Tax=Paenibacillus TaxID=44249 RepID=A0ABW3SGL0_9BACL|nr:response regulator transcription factor [Paenibacillus timonensis]MCH1642274.1 response regulator transcription factor [Paenibacillus timonensis]GJM80494.1 DNA-binding response regulator [Paenibacillus sp. HMSSN-139]
MRILIVEDEEDLARALAKGLKREGYAVDIALDGLIGWEMADTNEYDVMILDINLPELDGISLCQQIRRSSHHPDVLILMLTARSHPDEVEEGLDSGADDYLRKPFVFNELLARIRALLRRSSSVKSPVLQYEELTLDTNRKEVWFRKERISLTRKEFGLLEYLMLYPGEVISSERLLEHVWDIHADPLSSTVRVHINSLRRKLSHHDPEAGERYIQTVQGHGYKWAAFAAKKEEME